MRILYVSQYFPPEVNAPAVRVAELATRWAAAGHTVTVLTGFPNHPSGRLAPGYRQRWLRGIWRERMSGVDVLRSWLVPLPNRHSWQRMLNNSSFAAFGLATATLLGRRDVLIATSPQLLVGLIGYWYGKLRGVPFIFEVRDLWPESLAASGVRATESRLVAVLRGVARFLYDRADHIVCVTGPMRDRLIAEWRIPEDKVSVVGQGVDTDAIRPASEDERIAAKDRWDVAGRFVVGYVGTLGAAHGLETVLDAAEELRDKAPAVLFLLVGDGARRDALVADAQQRGLSNVRFVLEQPRDAIPSILAALDLGLVLLRPSLLFSTVMPTKLLEYMAAGCPVLSNVDGEARRVVEEADCGWHCLPDASGSLADTIMDLVQHRAALSEAGENGRRYAESHFDRDANAETYIKLLGTIAGQHVAP